MTDYKLKYIKYKLKYLKYQSGGYPEEKEEKEKKEEKEEKEEKKVEDSLKLSSGILPKVLLPLQGLLNREDLESLRQTAKPYYEKYKDIHNYSHLFKFKWKDIDTIPPHAMQ